MKCKNRTTKINNLKNLVPNMAYQGKNLFSYDWVEGNTLYESSLQDKIDFICCTFEVAFSDGQLHYLEEHAIKKIATILNVNHKDIINSKKEIEKYLK